MLSKWYVTGVMVVILMFVLGCLVRLPEPSRDFTSTEIAQRLRNSTVRIVVRSRDPKNYNHIRVSSGSGFCIQKGYIATNYHVIAGMQPKLSKVYITGSKRSYAIQNVVDYDTDYDIAIISCLQLKAVPLILGRNNDIRIGDIVYTAGSPKGFIGTFSSGVISNIRDSHFRSYDDRIQFTAPISSGSSGSPLVNSRGLVVGVVRSSAQSGNSIHFASPVDALRNLIQRSGL